MFVTHYKPRASCAQYTSQARYHKAVMSMQRALTDASSGYWDVGMNFKVGQQPPLILNFDQRYC